MIALFALAAAAATVAPDKADDVSIQALHNCGVCVVEHSPRGAREALDLDYESLEYRTKVIAVLRGNADYCIGNGQMIASPVLYAGSIAEALLKSTYDVTDLPLLLAYDP